jgi:hypothetical protein
MHRREFLAVLFLLILVFPAAATGVVRSMDQGEDGITTITLTTPEGAVMGITETIPDGTVIIACSLPQSQWRAEGEYLHMAILGEQHVSYTLQGTVSGAPSGTWVNFSDGSSGRVTSEGEEVSPAGDADAAATSSGPVPDATQAGSAPVMTVGALAALAFTSYLGRRGGI